LRKCTELFILWACLRHKRRHHCQDRSHCSGGGTARLLNCSESVR